MRMHLSIGLVLAVVGQFAAAAERPNVLFLISDDLSAKALGCYGNKQCRTPHIDALADRSVRFTRAYCQFPVCGPSRASLMSGRYPQACGVTGNGSSDRFTQVMGDRPSMSQHFIQNGYYAARVSKIYHMRVPGDITAGVDGPDHAASWTERFNAHAPEWMSSGHHMHLSKEKLNRDPDKHYNLGFGGAFYVVETDTDGSEQPDAIAADKAIELMKAHRNEPFFLAVGFVRPHVPLVAPAKYSEPYPPQKMELAERKPGDQDDIPKLGMSRTTEQFGMESQPWRQQRALAAYYASVSFMDEQVGRVLSALDDLELREKTIVVFTADHGWHLGEHDFWQKMSLHEESVRIPILIDAPEKSSSVTDSLAEQIDIFPTLSSLAGLEIPAHCQGKSLVPVIDDPQVNVREDAYCYKKNGHLLRTDRWAYLSWQDGTAELYDMANDPQQFTNLVDRAEVARTIDGLRKQLASRVERITSD